MGQAYSSPKLLALQNHLYELDGEDKLTAFSQHCLGGESHVIESSVRTKTVIGDEECRKTNYKIVLSALADAKCHKGNIWVKLDSWWLHDHVFLTVNSMELVCYCFLLEFYLFISFVCFPALDISLQKPLIQLLMGVWSIFAFIVRHYNSFILLNNCFAGSLHCLTGLTTCW